MTVSHFDFPFELDEQPGSEKFYLATCVRAVMHNVSWVFQLVRAESLPLWVF